MSDIQFRDGIMIDKRTGILKTFDLDKNPEYYAVVVKCGHVGIGRFIPILFPVSATSKEMAIELAKRMSRVKKENKSVILGIKQIDNITALTLGHINDCDPYLYCSYSNPLKATLRNRTITSQGTVAWTPDELHNENKIDPQDVRTADMYPERFVLQRYFAPVKYGRELRYPKKANMSQLIDDYIYQNTIELGIKKGKVTTLCYYYQIYGKNNNLGISFDGKNIVYHDLDDVEQILEVPENILKHLINMPEEPTVKKEEFVPVELESAKDKFNKRFQKYQNMLNQNIKE